jgi:hypothetical protein
MDKYEKIREINSWLDMHLGGISGSQLGSWGTWVQHVGRIYSGETFYRILKKDGTTWTFEWAPDTLIDELYWYVGSH